MNPSEWSTQISKQDFLAMGVNNLAYVKPVVIDGQPLFAIHAADGAQIAVMANLGVAHAAIRQHDMEPVSVH